MPTDRTKSPPAESSQEAGAPPKPFLHIFKQRFETVQLPAPYADFTITLYVNPTDDEVTAWNGEGTMGGYLWHLITGWTLCEADGTPVPVSQEALGCFPYDLMKWLWDEVGTRRTAPLVPPKPTALNGSTAKAS